MKATLKYRILRLAFHWRFRGRDWFFGIVGLPTDTEIEVKADSVITKENAP